MVKQLEQGVVPDSSEVMPVPQSSVIAYRQGERCLEYCLITSRRKQRWIFPKGPELDRSGAVEAARGCAGDEAGLTGEIDGDPVGSYRRLKDGILLEVTVFLMKVESIAKTWPESNVRQRRWLSYGVARGLIVKPELQDMLGRAQKRIGG